MVRASTAATETRSARERADTRPQYPESSEGHPRGVPRVAARLTGSWMQGGRQPWTEALYEHQSTVDPPRRERARSVDGGSVDELLDVLVERPVLHELQVEVGRTLEDRVEPGLPGDDREERHLHEVDEAGGHQRPVQRQAAVRAHRH